jgi:hypothetical protein
MRLLRSSRPEVAIPLARIAFGVGAWARPTAVGRTLGLPVPADHAAILFTRVFAARDVALGAGALVGAPRSRNAAIALGIACDVADAAAGILILREGGPKRAGVLTALAATGGAAVGVLALAAAGRKG